MNVLKIVVDELPENCLSCDISQKHGLDLYCPLINKVLYDAIGYLPEDCPLVVEECCEWKKGKNHSLYFNPHIETMGYIASAKNDLKFCHDCGKRIKYIESE